MWEYNTWMLMKNFMSQELSVESIATFMEYFDLSAYKLPDYIRNAVNLCLVEGSPDYSFSSDDLVWLGYAPAVGVCENLDDHIIFAELDVDNSDYYIVSAALIKLFNKAFPGNNGYVFRVSQSVAFGYRRNLDLETKNNFCVTRLFAEEDADQCIAFLEEACLSGSKEVPGIIIEFSPQEAEGKTSLYDRHEKDEDYIQFLRDLKSTYELDTTGEYVRYIDSLDYEQKNAITYEDAAITLSHIGEDGNRTSYEILDDAEMAQLKAEKGDLKIKTTQEKPVESYNDDLSDEFNYSDEAFDDAEMLLKEMLERDKNPNN